MRENVLQELLDTEKNYVEYLSLYVEHIVLPLQQSNVLEEKTAKILFNNGNAIMVIVIFFISGANFVY